MRHFALLHHISTVHIQICDKNAVRYYSSFPVYVSIRAIGMTAHTKKMSMVLNKLCTHSSKWNSSVAWSERERVNDEKIATKKAHLPLVEQCSCYFDGYIYKNSLHTWQTSNACRQAHITGLLFGNVHTLVCRVSSNDWQESTKITVLPFYILLSSVFIAYSYSTSELLLLFFSLPFLPWHLTRVGLNGSRLNWKQRPNSKNNREVLSNENDTNICYFCSIFTTAFEEFLVDSTILSVYIFMYVCVRVFNIKSYVLT